jgi:hypothetical protein
MIRGQRRSRARGALAALVTSLVCIGLSLQCGGDGASAADSGADSTSPDSGPVCAPGASVACAGPGGCTGYQVCNSEGSSFDSCICAEAGDDSGPSAATDAGPDAGDAFVPNDGPAALRGAVQKGPFVLGSTVTLSTIDATGNSTGQVYTTQTTTDLGDFAVSFTYRGNVDMQAQGFYYDEVTGTLSTSPIVLRALYQVTNGGPQGAYINIITHLAHDRAINLMGDAGLTLSAAEAQAESEVVKALGIGGTGFTLGSTGVTLNELGGDSDANAYSFAVSAVLVQAALEQAGEAGSVDATLQELVDTIALTVANGGSLSPALASELRTAEEDLDVDYTMDLFQRRLQAIGSNGAPADLNRAIDSDGDGYRNSVDTCPLVANADQAQIPTGVICKAARYTTWLPPASAGYAPVILGDFANAGHGGALLGSNMDEDDAGATLCRGDGAGHFSLSSTLIPSKLLDEAFDVNEDGKLDLASEFGWSPGDGAGGFGGFMKFPDPAGTPPAYDGTPVLGDFSGDGLVDVVRAATTSSSSGSGPGVPLEIVVSLATAKGVFAPPTVMQPTVQLPDGGVSPIYGTTVLAGDVNGDHKLDIVIGWISLLGDGSGHFTTKQPLSLESTPAGSEVLADIDGDGNLDVLTVGSGFSRPSSVTVAFGDGTGEFGQPVATSLDPTLLIADTGDLNADRKTDLVVSPMYANSTLATLEVVPSDGRTFASPQRLHSRWIDTSRSLRVSDMNGDGFADVVLVGQEPGGDWTIQVILTNVMR